MRFTSPSTLILPLVAVAAFALSGCSEGGDPANTDAHDHTEADHDESGHTHAEADHDDDHEHAHAEADDDHDHAHGEEVSIGSATIGDIAVDLAQGHGAVAAGKEGHLVVKLPYNDKGATIVRVWIGSSDRTLSYVGKGEYAPSHDGYDAHAIAPDPLPADAMWWIEIEKPDGTKAVGSAKPITG